MEYNYREPCPRLLLNYCPELSAVMIATNYRYKNPVPSIAIARCHRGYDLV